MLQSIELQCRKLSHRQRSNAALKRERNIKHERSENTGLDGADNDIELLHERPAKFRKLVETIDLTGDGDDE